MDFLSKWAAWFGATPPPAAAEQQPLAPSNLPSLLEREIARMEQRKSRRIANGRNYLGESFQRD
jgi:hypothetical protein